MRLRKAPAIAAATKWWNSQTERTRLGLIAAAAFTVIGVLSLSLSVGRPAPGQADAARPAAAVTLTQEAAPSDAGKIWNVRGVWQGTGNRETDVFTVTGHWRVDWIFNPTQTGGAFQVYIYSAEGRLLQNLAASVQKGGADSSFWLGPGTYFLKVTSSGGDWKLDVQDLR